MAVWDNIYRSKYNSAVKELYEKEKSDIPRTMGYTRTPLRPPSDYLKKHSGERKLESGAKSVPCLCREPRQCCQKKSYTYKTETSILPRDFKRDFLKENALLVLKRPVLDPQPKIMDDRKGHSLELENSGLVPKYLYKEDYGRKPKFIEEIDKNLIKSRKEFNEFLIRERQLTSPVKMDEDTKKEIFEGLVKNWKELLRRYLMLPMQTDTPAQLRRKQDIEKRIDSLERDIELLMRHKDIFIGKKFTR